MREIELMRGMKVLQDTETGQTYARIAGGVMFSAAATPGCAVAIGQNIESRHSGAHRLYVLEELQTTDNQLLYNRMLELQLKRQVSSWYGFMEPWSSRLLMMLNDEASAKAWPKTRNLYIEPAPYTHEESWFETHLQIVKEYLRKGTLHFAPDSKIRAALTQVSPDAGLKRNYVEYPLICALGFVVNAFKFWTLVPGTDLLQDHDVTDDSYEILPGMKL